MRSATATAPIRQRGGRRGTSRVMRRLAASCSRANRVPMASSSTARSSYRRQTQSHELRPMRSVVEDAEEAAMDRQPGFIGVIDKAQLPELIHEDIDPRSGCADHLRQVFLTDPGNDRFGLALLAKTREQQETPSQTLLAGVEDLVDEIRFVSD